MDSIEDAGEVRPHVGIPESKYFISLGLQPFISLQVSRYAGIPSMLASVNFDD
jgi:hypothetical protein